MTTEKKWFHIDYEDIDRFINIRIVIFLCNIFIVDFMKVCDECGMQFKDNAELGIHMRQNHKKFYCGVHKKEFDNEVEFQYHLKTIHGIASNTLA